MKHIKVSKSLAALNVLKVLRLLPLSLLFFSCLDDDSLEQPDTFMGNFEACWQTLDQHYCFFDEKGWTGRRSMMYISLSSETRSRINISYSTSSMR